MTGKSVIISAPSGSGKTTLVNHILKKFPDLEFSVSATSREPRENEEDEKNYYFLNPSEFRKKIKNDEFVEWEEVYKDMYYGTLKSELQKIWKKGKHVIFDVDVFGGLNLKKIFGDKALSVFVSVPSIGELEKRLRNRSTDPEEIIMKRLAKARHEMAYSTEFDVIIVNDDLERACREAEKIVNTFISKS